MSGTRTSTGKRDGSGVRQDQTVRLSRPVKGPDRRRQSAELRLRTRRVPQVAETAP